MSDIDSYQIGGSPDPRQEQIIVAALEKMLRDEHPPRSRWKMSARAAALGVGAADLRSRGGEWTDAKTIGWQGQGPQDLRGRGDAK